MTQDIAIPRTDVSIPYEAERKNVALPRVVGLLTTETAIINGGQVYGLQVEQPLN